MVAASISVAAIWTPTMIDDRAGRDDQASQLDRRPARSERRRPEREGKASQLNRARVETKAINLAINVANGIVDEASKAGAGAIAVEDLKGIRTRIKCAKKQRLIMHGWPFSSLFLKVAHVAGKHGVKVESVDARNTSRVCSCGHVDKANRTTQSTFRCVVCGYSHNADYVASHNIAVRYVEQRCESVTSRPRVRPSGQG